MICLWVKDTTEFDKLLDLEFLAKNEHGFFIHGYVVGGLENLNSGTFGVVLLVKLENSFSWALCCMCKLTGEMLTERQ